MVAVAVVEDGEAVVEVQIEEEEEEEETSIATEEEACATVTNHGNVVVQNRMLPAEISKEDDAFVPMLVASLTKVAIEG